jgi:ubiquitin-protein ligase
MASTKRLLKERANIARDPIPYVTFQEDNDGDEKMSDDAAGTSSSSSSSADINQWRFVLALDSTHDALGDVSEIGRAADSPYCNPPPPSTSSSSSSSLKGIGGAAGGLLASVTRAAKGSKKSSSSDTAGGGGGRSSSSGTWGGSAVASVAYFAFQLDFTPNYPFKPPTITVLGPSYHPNIKGTTGEMCDPVLTGEGWGPTLNVRKICMRLRKFLCEPDPDHPLEGDIAQLFVEKPQEYAATAYKHASEHATRAKAEDAMARGKQAK